MSGEITHERLVMAAAAWLGRNCRIVATEPHTNAAETPDAVGWNGQGRCSVVECKTSRADFRANADKCIERLGIGAGTERWFLTPPKLVDADEVPAGWGLLEFVPSGHANGYYIKKVVEAPRRERTPQIWREETVMLVSIAGRALEAASRLKAVWLGDEIDAAAPSGAGDEEEGEGGR